MGEPSDSDVAHRQAWLERQLMRSSDRRPALEGGPGWFRSRFGFIVRRQPDGTWASEGK